MSTLLEMRIEELEEQSAALAAHVEALNQKNFELTCYRVDVLRCLKTVAFEHNHADVPLYQPLARQLMDSISANEELKEVRADAGRAHFSAGYNAGYQAGRCGADNHCVEDSIDYASILAGKADQCQQHESELQKAVRILGGEWPESMWSSKRFIHLIKHPSGGGYATTDSVNHPKYEYICTRAEFEECASNILAGKE